MRNLETRWSLYGQGLKTGALGKEPKETSIGRRIRSQRLRGSLRVEGNHRSPRPGARELLGNHTDYNGGLVLAAAIDRYTVVAGGLVPGRKANVNSVQFNQNDVFTLDKIEPGGPSSRGRCVRGAARAVQERFGPLSSGFVRRRSAETCRSGRACPIRRARKQRRPCSC